MGNHLRHAYERVDLESVWQPVTDDLPILKVAVLGALGGIEGESEDAPHG
jgi:uncharacterized protein with HEPN domain